MNLQILQKQIKEKKLDNFYIFVGDEINIQKQYINIIAKTLDLIIEYVYDFKSIYNKLNISSLFSNRKLYIILDDTDIIKQEKAWLDINPGNNILIFKYNNLDKRSKFYKQFEDKIVEFEKLSDEVLTKYIQREISLSDKNSKKLIDICNSSYNQILLEIDKIINYASNKNVIWDEDFEELEQKGAFHKEISDITFEFVDKVLKRDIKSIYNLQKQLKQIGESNIKLLSLLYTNFKTILLIQSCKTNDICKTTGLQYYQVKYNQDKLNYYSIAELVNCLKMIQKLEEGIKTGLYDENLTIDYLLINIL